MKNLSDGTFDLGEMVEGVRTPDDHHPITTLVCIENTQNKCGGVALPVQWIDQVCNYNTTTASFIKFSTPPEKLSVAARG